MKKFKLFLLTWVVSILSIGSFTNAKYEFVKDITFACNQDASYSLNVINSPWLYKVIVTDSSWRDIKYVTFRCPNDWNKFIINWSNNFVFDYWWTAKCSIYLTNSSFYWEGCASAVLYKDVPVFNFWWPSALTPAVDWLRWTVNQIIPYVIFIWIWVLLAILWFYAIRWLVNWIWRKINSVFSSKKR